MFQHGGYRMKSITKVSGAFRAITKNLRRHTGQKQDIGLYFDPEFAELLEVWAVDSAWREIRLFLSERKGKVLDLACGTGRTHDFLADFKELEYYGCDISEMLIDRAVERGIDRSRLAVADATNLSYETGMFDYVFSIGSLEHFSQDGLLKTISECHRICRGLNFHQVPVSLSGFNEGWITPYQSYWNNSERWWIDQFEHVFGKNVWVMNSKWGDDKSRGAWFISVST